MELLEQNLLTPTIPGEFVFDAIQACKRCGVDGELLIAEAGIDLNQLGLKGCRVSVDHYSKLIELIISETGHGFFGFLDENFPPRAFSVFAAHLAACRNLEQVFEQFNRFLALFTKQFWMEITLDVETAVIVLGFKETQDFDYRFFYQSILITVVRLTNWLIGEEVTFKVAKFTFDEAGLDKHLSYLFGCPLEFSQERNEIHLDRELLSIPCSTTLEQVNVMLRDSRRMMLINHRPSPFTRQVRESLILNRQQGWLSIENVADKMNLSKNLLWRKLKKENTTFLQIRDDVKRDLAISLIADTELTVSSVAETVGFNEVSAFNKAFKKWLGVSPSVYRKNLFV